VLTIIGRRVNLREFRAEDAAWLVRMMARGTWWKWDAPWEGPPSEDELRQVPVRIAAMVREAASPPRRMIIETRAGSPIGTVSRYWVDERTQWLEVGVGIYAARNWGRGFGPAALGLWVDHLFEALELRRVGLRTWSGNERMVRLARRLGFKREAVFREAYATADRAHDRVAFGLLRREWQRVRRSWPG